MSATFPLPSAPAPERNLLGIPKPVTERFEFTGSGSEYFRIWIVNLALSLVTLGIYSAWAKVRRLRYFYGSTRVAGSSFEYHGKPLAILKGRLIAIVLLALGTFLVWQQPLFFLLYALVLGVLTPVIVVRGRLFRMRMTSYRNIRFDFERDYRGAYRAFFWLPIAASLLFFLYPYARGAQYNFAISNTRFGTTRFELTAEESSFFGIYFLAGLILVGGAIVMLFLLTPLTAWLEQNGWALAYPGLNLLPMYLAVGLAYLPFIAYLNRSIGNHTLGKTRLGESRLLCDMRFMPLFRIYLSNAVLLVLTLGLYYPWARVKTVRYQLDCLALEVQGGMDQFIGEQQSKVSATGEELSEILDVDIGL